MAQIANIKTQLLQQVFDAKSMLDENNVYLANNGKPAELSAKVTWLLGHEMFPMLWATEGGVADYTGGKLKPTNIKELDNEQYNYPAITRTDKAAEIAVSSYATTDKPGLAGSEFTITMTDNWIKRHFIVETPRRVQLYVTKDPEPTGQGWKYTVKLDPAPSSDSYCPPSELTSGTQLIATHTVNAASESRGTEFQRVMPGKIKNQITFVRASHSWAGNVANMVMSYQIEMNGEKLTEWMDWEQHQFEYKWAIQKETALWYSRYNRNTDGTINLKDAITGKPIPRGSGILEQIPNYYTYSKLTFKKLQQVIRESLFAQGDMGGKQITLYTGTGGYQEFNNALKQGGFVEVIPTGTILADHYITGTGYNLALGGYFDKFYHIDGYTVKVKKVGIFDKGPRAMNSLKHPETGLPLESYRMVFVDDTDYDGQPNIQAVALKGRIMQQGIVPGLTDMPKTYRGFGTSNGIQILATDVDKASYHRMTSTGIQLMRNTGCIHLECLAGY